MKTTPSSIRAAAIGVGVMAVRHRRVTSVGDEAHRTVTIQRSRDEVFARWRQVEELPRLMRHLRAVDLLDAPGGGTQVHVAVSYAPSAGTAAAAGDRYTPGQLAADLARLRDLLEAAAPVRAEHVAA